jgi:hypothetical protein
MATQSYGADKNIEFDNVTETLASGVTMTYGVEVNIDFSKIDNKQQALEALERIEAFIVESANWPA